MAHSHGLLGSHEVLQLASQEFATFLPLGNLNFLEPPLNFLQDNVLASPELKGTPKYFVNHLKALILLLSPAPPGSDLSSPPHSLLITNDVGPKTPPKKKIIKVCRKKSVRIKISQRLRSRRMLCNICPKKPVL